MSRNIPWKYKWDHQSSLHRAAVRGAQSALRLIPNSVKYQVAGSLKQKRLPYSLVTGGYAVQVGAPFDTLMAGRSRAAHLGFAVGAEGRLLVIEPLAQSCEIFEDFARDCLPCQTIVLNAGAWSEPGTIDLNVDVAHPATNFSGDLVGYGADRLSDFETVVVRSDTIDSLVAEAGIGDPDLVSITTNWAEEQILQGTSGLQAAGLRYLALALGENNEDYRSLMEALGYRLLGYEDRGATYERKASPN